MAQTMLMQGENKVPPSPRPWSVKRTGSDISILDRDKKVVIKKVVSQLSMEQFAQLRDDFQLIVTCVNQQK